MLIGFANRIMIQSTQVSRPATLFCNIFNGMLAIFTSSSSWVLIAGAFDMTVNFVEKELWSLKKIGMSEKKNKQTATQFFLVVCLSSA